MINATMELATNRALEAVERVQRHASAESRFQRFAISPIVANFFDWLLSRKMRSHAENLSENVLLLRSLVQFDDEQVDPDLHLRDTLDRVVEKVDRMRSNTKALLLKVEKAEMKRLAHECRRFVAVADELRASARRLQWEMAEHDADRAFHHDGFVSSDRETLDNLLDQISAS